MWETRRQKRTKYYIYTSRLYGALEPMMIKLEEISSEMVKTGGCDERGDIGSELHGSNTPE